jgi:integrase
MLGKGRSITTVGIYLRALRTLLNEAIQKGLIGKEAYPFGSKKPLYKIPSGQNIKKALSGAELGRIYKYKPETPSEARALDFWVFSYLCNGINPKDIALLRYKDLDRQSRKITFRRAKTKRTSQGSKPVEVYLQPRAIEILELYGNKPEKPDDFIFPILGPGDDDKKQDADIGLFVSSINTGMRAVVKKLGIEKTVSTIAARHSAATQLKRKGASMAFISESLGHQNQRTTESYMGRFEDEEKRKFGEALLDFDTPDKD